MFRRGLLDKGSSPFALITTSVVRILLSPDCITWNNPSRLSKVYSKLDIYLKPSPFYATSFRINSWKYAYFGDLDAGVAMTTQSPCPLPDIRIVLSCPDFFLFNSVYTPALGEFRTEFLPPLIMHTQTETTSCVAICIQIYAKRVRISADGVVEQRDQTDDSRFIYEPFRTETV